MQDLSLQDLHAQGKSKLLEDFDVKSDFILPELAEPYRMMNLTLSPPKDRIFWTARSIFAARLGGMIASFSVSCGIYRVAAR